MAFTDESALLWKMNRLPTLSKIAFVATQRRMSGQPDQIVLNSVLIEPDGSVTHSTVGSIVVGALGQKVLIREDALNSKVFVLIQENNTSKFYQYSYYPRDIPHPTPSQPPLHVRGELELENWTTMMGHPIKDFALDPDRKTIYVVGASGQGADIFQYTTLLLSGSMRLVLPTLTAPLSPDFIQIESFEKIRYMFIGQSNYTPQNGVPTYAQVSLLDQNSGQWAQLGNELTLFPTATNPSNIVQHFRLPQIITSSLTPITLRPLWLTALLDSRNLVGGIADQKLLLFKQDATFTSNALSQPTSRTAMMNPENYSLSFSDIQRQRRGVLPQNPSFYNRGVYFFYPDGGDRKSYENQTFALVSQRYQYGTSQALNDIYIRAAKWKLDRNDVYFIGENNVALAFGDAISAGIDAHDDMIYIADRKRFQVLKLKNDTFDAPTLVGTQPFVDLNEPALAMSVTRIPLIYPTYRPLSGGRPTFTGRRQFLFGLNTKPLPRVTIPQTMQGAGYCAMEILENATLNFHYEPTPSYTPPTLFVIPTFTAPIFGSQTLFDANEGGVIVTDPALQTTNQQRFVFLAFLNRLFPFQNQSLLYPFEGTYNYAPTILPDGVGYTDVRINPQIRSINHTVLGGLAGANMAYATWENPTTNPRRQHTSIATFTEFVAGTPFRQRVAEWYFRTGYAMPRSGNQSTPIQSRLESPNETWVYEFGNVPFMRTFTTDHTVVDNQQGLALLNDGWHQVSWLDARANQRGFFDTHDKLTVDPAYSYVAVAGKNSLTNKYNLALLDADPGFFVNNGLGLIRIGQPFVRSGTTIGSISLDEPLGGSPFDLVVPDLQDFRAMKFAQTEYEVSYPGFANAFATYLFIASRAQNLFQTAPYSLYRTGSVTFGGGVSTNAKYVEFPGEGYFIDTSLQGPLGIPGSNISYEGFYPWMLSDPKQIVMDGTGRFFYVLNGNDILVFTLNDVGEPLFWKKIDPITDCQGLLDLKHIAM